MTVAVHEDSDVEIELEAQAILHSGVGHYTTNGSVSPGGEASSSYSYAHVAGPGAAHATLAGFIDSMTVSAA